jgi:hypothetical protein
MVVCYSAEQARSRAGHKIKVWGGLSAGYPPPARGHAHGARATVPHPPYRPKNREPKTRRRFGAGIPSPLMIFSAGRPTGLEPDPTAAPWLRLRRHHT